jgi:OOP family OmpA-OmpF porin
MKQLFLGAAALILSAAAAAETYVGAAIGPSNIEANCDFTTSCDGSDTGFKIYGGFVLPQSPLAGLALEVGYIDFGTGRATTVFVERTVEATALTMNGALRVKFTPALQGVGRLGLGYVNGKDNGIGVLGINAKSKSNMALYAGLGLEYALNKQVKLTGSADFTSYDTGNQSGSARLISIGAQYGF